MKLYFLESEVSGGHGEQNIYGVEEDNLIRKSYPESLEFTIPGISKQIHDTNY